MMPSRGIYLCVMLGMLAVVTPVSCRYMLSGPKNYTVFAGPIPVDYKYPSNVTLTQGLVLLVSLDKNIVVAETGIPNYNEATLQFSCGVIDHAGRFLFRMVNERGGPVLVESEPLNAVWPRFELTLPSSHTALTNQVILIFSSQNSQCTSARDSVRYSLDVVYFGKNNSDGSISQPKTVIHSLALRNFHRLRNAQFKFACKLFDQAGIYEVHFTTTANPGSPIATSNSLVVAWSDAYSLRVHSESIFPCDSYITVSYTHPPCSGDDDKIRLYRQVQLVESSAASPYVMEYQAEKRVQRGGSTVLFECDQFDEDVPVYCFKYASIAQNLAVTEQAIKCVPTLAGSGVWISSALTTAGRAGWAECGERGATGTGTGSRQRRDSSSTD